MEDYFRRFWKKEKGEENEKVTITITITITIIAIIIHHHPQDHISIALHTPGKGSLFNFLLKYYNALERLTKELITDFKNSIFIAKTFILDWKSPNNGLK